MPLSFFSTSLLTVSLITNLSVQGIKKLLEGTSFRYSSNILAAALAVVLAFAICVIYLVWNDIAFSAKVGVEMVVLMYTSFLTSTVGYDKVIQTIRQIQNA